MITNNCLKCSDPNAGMGLNSDDSAIKCYMGDTGLLFSHAFNENAIARDSLYKQIMNDKLSINKGMLYENAIAQMLTASGHRLYFFTRYNKEQHRNDMEIDFLLSDSTNGKVIPIEVKSSKKLYHLVFNRFQKNLQKAYQQIVHHPPQKLLHKRKRDYLHPALYDNLSIISIQGNYKSQPDDWGLTTYLQIKAKTSP